MSDEQETTETPEATSPTAEVPQDSGDDGGQEPVQRVDQQNGDPRPSRRERRAARVDTEAARREAEDWRRRFEERDQEFARLREQQARLEGFVAANLRGQDNNGPEQQIASLTEKAEQHLANAASAKDAATAKREMAEYHKALRQATLIEAQQAMEQRFGQFQQSIPDAETAGMKISLSQEFPWLGTNAQARAAADGYIAVLRSRGKPDALATYREACAMAARDFNLGGHQPPTNGQRGRYGGPPTGEGAGGGESGPMSIAWNDGLQRMAQGLYKNLDPDQAKARWLKEIGPSYLASMRRAG